MPGEKKDGVPTHYTHSSKVMEKNYTIRGFIIGTFPIKQRLIEAGHVAGMRKLINALIG